MITIAIIDNQPAESIPKNTIAILNNGTELQCYFEGEDLPAILQPQPEQPQPNWDNFRKQISLSPAYLAIVGFNSQCLAINQSLIYILGNAPERTEEIALYWNAIAQLALPTSEQIATLNLIAINNNIPFYLNEEGLIA